MSPLRERLLDIWERRDVLRMLTERGLRQKYAGSVLGYAWSLLEPALFIMTYFLLLKIFHRSYPMYPLFIGSAILPWQWFASTVNGSTSTLRRNARLITSIALPREIYPLADVAVKAIEFILSLPILIVVAWFYGVRPSPLPARLAAGGGARADDLHRHGPAGVVAQHRGPRRPAGHRHRASG